MLRVEKQDGHVEVGGVIAAELERYQRAIYGYLAHLVRDRGWADELAQKTFRAALAAGDRIPGIPARRAWLFRLATDQALAAIKRRRRWSWLVGPWTPGPHKANRVQNTAPRADASHRADAAHQTNAAHPVNAPHRPEVELALAAMPPEQVAALLLYGRYGLSPTEIAHVFRIDEADAIARLYRARVQLRHAREPVVQGDHGEFKMRLAVYDSLDEPHRGALNAHLVTCSECAEELAGHRRMDRALRSLTELLPSSGLQALLHAAATPAQRPDLPKATPPARLEDRQPVSQPEPVAELPAPLPIHSPAWQRLLLPLAMALLFVAGLWLGMRGEDGPARNRVIVDPPATVIPNLPDDRSLPLPAELPLTIDASGHVTITFACDDVAAVYKDYAAIARAFEAQNPDISIILKSHRDILGSTLATLYESGDEGFMQAMLEISSRADVFCARRVPELARWGIIRDLSPLIARDPPFDLPDYYAVVLQAALLDDAVYGLPGRFQPTLIHYNPQAFDEAGLAYPQPGWTWSDFRAAAIALTLREDGNTQRWGFGEDRAAVFRGRLAEALRDATFNAAPFGSDISLDPAMVELFTWYEDFYVNERAALPPRPVTANSTANSPDDAYRSQILRGKLAMWTDQFYMGARRQGRPAPFPADNAVRGGTPVTTGVIWVMSDEVQHTDAAWRWLSYLSRNPPPDPVQMLPARKSLVEQADFWADLPAEDARIYRYILDHLAPWPDFSNDQPAQGLALLLEAVSRSEIGAAEVQAIAEDREPTAASSAAETITINFAAPRDQLSDYERAAAGFSSTNPGIRIRVAPSEDLLTSRSGTEVLWNQMRVLAGRVDAMVNAQVPALVRSGRAQGILFDLTEMISKTLQRADYYPNTLEGLEWRGRGLALPGRIGLQLIHYNEWIFDQADVAYPQHGWRWDDFDATVRAVGLRGSDTSSWWGFSENTENDLPLLKARAGDLVDYATDPATARLGQSQVMDAAAWYAGLTDDGLLAPSDEPPSEAAMWIAPLDLETFASLAGADIGAASFPVSPDASATTPLEIQEAYAISADTAHPEAAWQWLMYLQSHPPARTAAVGGLSARRDGNATLQLGEDDTLRAEVEYALEHAQRPAPLRSEEYLVTQQLLAALERMAEGQDVRAAMEQAQAAAQQDLVQRQR